MYDGAGVNCRKKIRFFSGKRQKKNLPPFSKNSSNSFSVFSPPKNADYFLPFTPATSYIWEIWQIYIKVEARPRRTRCDISTANITTCVSCIPSRLVPAVTHNDGFLEGVNCLSTIRDRRRRIRQSSSVHHIAIRSPRPARADETRRWLSYRDRVTY